MFFWPLSLAGVVCAGWKAPSGCIRMCGWEWSVISLQWLTEDGQVDPGGLQMPRWPPGCPQCHRQSVTRSLEPTRVSGFWSQPEGV